MGAAPGQLLLLLLAAAPHTLAVAQPTANTTDGVVRGRVYAGCNVFRGVPFAEPPTGPLRWRSPRPKEPWRDVREAAIPAAQCPQLDLLKGLYLGKEDCLYLSVYSPPSCTSDSPCPVMFWIYGGAWSIGGNGEFGLYTGQHLAMKHGVVVVSTNYRLDVLGWLALEELTGDDGGYANWGLRDQTLALHWTPANVRSFGGDPAQVTIFGESAGGFSVCQVSERFRLIDTPSKLSVCP
jgi:para-nitrobenzyl esterase